MLGKIAVSLTIDEGFKAQLIETEKQTKSFVERMQKALEGLGDFTKLDNGIANFVNKLKKAQDSGKVTETTYIRLRNQLTRYDNAINDTNRRLEIAKTKLNEARNAGEKNRETIERLEGSVRNYGNKLQSLNGNLDATKSKINQLANSSKSVAQELSKSGNQLRNFGSTITTLGVGITAVMAPVSVGLGKATKEFILFEDQIANVAKTIEVDLADAVNGFGQELLKYAMTTRTSMEDLLTITTVGGQMGIGADNIIEFTKAVDVLNVALGENFENAEDLTRQVGALSLIFNEFRGKDTAQSLLYIGNALNVLDAKGNATSQVIADFAARIGGVAAPLGLTAGQILGLSAAMQELQIAPERGSSALVRVLQLMGTNVEDFAKISRVSAKEFTEIYNKDVYGAFLLVLKGINEAKDGNVQFIRVLDELGLSGVYTAEALGKLSENEELLSQRVLEGTDSIVAQNSVFDEYQRKNNTLAGKLGQLKNIITVLGVEIGYVLAPYLEKVVEFLKNFGMQAIKAFEGLPEGVKVGILAIAGLIATIGPLVVVFGTLIGSVGTIISAIGAFGGLIASIASPIGIAVIAIVGIVGAITALVGIMKEATRSGSGLGAIFQKIGIDISNGLVAGVSSALRVFANLVLNFFANLVTSVKNFLGIHSPSRVFAEIGENIGDGLSEGLQGSTRNVDASVGGILRTLQSFGSQVSSIGGRTVVTLTELNRVIARQEATYNATKKATDALSASYADLEKQLKAVVETPIEGEKAFNDQTKAIQKQIKELELQKINIQLQAQDANGAEISEINEQLALLKIRENDVKAAKIGLELQGASQRALKTVNDDLDRIEQQRLALENRKTSLGVNPSEIDKIDAKIEQLRQQQEKLNLEFDLTIGEQKELLSELNKTDTPEQKFENLVDQATKLKQQLSELKPVVDQALDFSAAQEMSLAELKEIASDAEKYGIKAGISIPTALIDGYKTKEQALASQYKSGFSQLEGLAKNSGNAISSTFGLSIDTLIKKAEDLEEKTKKISGGKSSDSILDSLISEPKSLDSQIEKFVEDMQKKAEETSNQFKGAFDISSWFTGNDAVNAFLDGIDFDGFARGFVNVFDGVQQAIAPVIKIVQDLWNMFQDSTVQQRLGQILSRMGQYFESWGDLVGSIVGLVVDFFLGDLMRALNTSVGGVSGLEYAVWFLIEAWDFSISVAMWLVDALDLLVDGLRYLVNWKQHAAEASEALMDWMYELATGTKRLKESVDDQADATAGLTRAQEEASTQTKELSGNFRDEQREARELERALEDLEGIHLTLSDNIVRVANATENVKLKQLAYEEAVNRFGENSPQAIKALNELTTATNGQERAVTTLEQSEKKVAEQLAAILKNEDALNKMSPEVLARQRAQIEKSIELAQKNGQQTTSLEDLIRKIDEVSRKKAVATIEVAIDSKKAQAEWAKLDSLFGVGPLLSKKNAVSKADGGIIPQYLAGGGRVGTFLEPKGTDTVPAMLTPGELVVPQDLTGRLFDVLSQLANLPGTPNIGSLGLAGSGAGASGINISVGQIIASTPQEAVTRANDLTYGIKRNLQSRGLI